MKKLAIILTIVATTAMIFSSCGKYEEGPSFTVLSAKMRITGEWSQQSFFINDADQDNSVVSEFTLNSDGTGTQTTSFVGYVTTTNDIEWKFNDDNTLLMFKDTDEDNWDEMTIKRLTNNELWLVEDTELLGIWEFRYEKV